MKLLTKVVLNSLILLPLINLFYLSNTLNFQIFTNSVDALAADTTVIINELMPNPVAPETELEWIELYNFGEAEINLQGWKIDSRAIGDVSIEADSFLILARNSASLVSVYPSLQNVYEVSFSLTNSGDTVTLQNPDGSYIDSVSYDSTTEEKSLERKGPKDTDFCRELIQHTSFNSIEATNSAKDQSCFESIVSEPEISRILFSTDELTWEESLSSVGDTEVFLDYDLSGVNEPVINETWELMDGSTIESPFEFSSFINQSIKLTIELQDGSFLNKTSEPIAVYPVLEMSEVMVESIGLEGDGAEGAVVLRQAQHDKQPRLPDVSSVGQQAPSYAKASEDKLVDLQSKEWLEIYNPNPFGVDLEDYYIEAFKDQDSSLGAQALAHLQSGVNDVGSSISTCGDLTKLTAQSYCIFIPSEDNFFEDGDGRIDLNISVGQSSLSAQAGFDSALRRSSVQAQDDTDNLKLNTVTYQNINPGNTYSNYRGRWFEGLPPTPGESNIYPTTVQISELYPSPDSSENETEWIEIFNYGEFSVNLTDWYFRDRGSSSEFGSSKSFLPDEYLIQPGDYLVVADPNLLISLNNSGDRVTLFNAFDEIIDSVLYDLADTGVSISKVYDSTNGRYLDDYSSAALSNFVPQSTIPTPGERNQFEEEPQLVFTDISTAKANQNGAEVAVEGYISALPGTFAEDIFYIADSSSGIKIDLASGIAFETKLGDNIRIIGKISENGNERKINVASVDDILTTDFNGVSLGTTELEFHEIKENDSWEKLEGQLVVTIGEIVDNFSSSFDLETVNGVIRVSIMNSTGIEIPEKNIGDKVNITGIMSQDGNQYRILPRFQSDLEILGESEGGADEEDVGSVSGDSNEGGSVSAGTASGINQADSVSSDTEYQLPVLAINSDGPGMYVIEEESGIYLWPVFLVGLILVGGYSVYRFELIDLLRQRLGKDDGKFDYFPESSVREVISDDK